MKWCIFLSSDVPPDVLTLTVTVMNRGKRAKDAEVAEVTVDMNKLASGSESEEWFQLSGLTQVGEWGALRLRQALFLDIFLVPSLRLNNVTDDSEIFIV